MEQQELYYGRLLASVACMQDGTTRLDEHKIKAAAALNLPASEPELHNRRLLQLACTTGYNSRLGEHEITATVGFKNPVYCNERSN